MASNDDDDDEADATITSSFSNLDPTVAALLEAPKDDVPKSDLRVRIAQMKMQQARIRGNSDYAAKIMDHAIEEGARDRTAWTLLDSHIRTIEEKISAIEDVKNDAVQATSDNDTGGGESNKLDEEETQQSTEGQDGLDNTQVDSAEVQRLREQLLESNESATALEDLLEQRLLHEIESVKAEQASIREREDRLRSTIRSLQLAIKQVPSSSKAKQLSEAMKDAYEYTFLNAECTVCHENSATRAVIPCGHLALCDECTKTIGKLDQSQQQCPLCRGNLLSTLHIYMTK